MQYLILTISNSKIKKKPLMHSKFSDKRKKNGLHSGELRISQLKSSPMGVLLHIRQAQKKSLDYLCSF
jgi:hypothetical protein